jgi:hypothetical protein
MAFFRGWYAAAGAHTRWRACGGLLLLASACGGRADSHSEPETADAPAVAISPRIDPAEPSEPDPEAIGARAPSDPALEGLPRSVVSIVSDPPDALDVDQFDALLAYYCSSTCHATSHGGQASDGFWFDDWAELAAGGNYGSENAERVLSRTVARLSDGSMPPPCADERRQPDQTTRVLMSEFVANALDEGSWRFERSAEDIEFDD